MINIFLQLISMFVLWMCIIPTVYYLVEIKGMPEWLNYKPFNCLKCCTFWASVGVFTSLFCIGHWWYLWIGGLVLSVLTAAAMYYNEWKEQQNALTYEDLMKK